jgi:hypothetical protein
VAASAMILVPEAVTAAVSATVLENSWSTLDKGFGHLGHPLYGTGGNTDVG